MLFGGLPLLIVHLMPYWFKKLWKTDMFKTPNCVDLRMNPYFIHGIIFLLAMILLVKGSDTFVDSAARLARRLGISQLVVGLTFVAVGTSIPELASSVIENRPIRH